MRDGEIAQRLNMARATVQRKRKKAEAKLRLFLEV